MKVLGCLTVIFGIVLILAIIGVAMLEVINVLRKQAGVKRKLEQELKELKNTFAPRTRETERPLPAGKRGAL